MHLLVPLLLTLAAGRYVAETPAGETVELVLQADGGAVFGGARYGWSAVDGALRLAAKHGTVVLRPDGACHLGSAFGRLCFRPAPILVPGDPPAPPRPEAWRGAWVFPGSGGDLVLSLDEDGGYEMRQPGLDTRGRWRGDNRSFTLTPSAGAPLTYAARRDGADLLVSGGDLPMEVRFRPHSAGRYTPPD